MGDQRAPEPTPDDTLLPNRAGDSERRMQRLREERDRLAAELGEATNRDERAWRAIRHEQERWITAESALAAAQAREERMRTALEAIAAQCDSSSAAGHDPMQAEYCDYKEHKIARAALGAPEGQSPPIPMVLHCPKCGLQHVDAPEPEVGWTNPPHKSHLCHGCRTVWRPAAVPTNGVLSVEPRGERDTWPDKDGVYRPSSPPAAPAQLSGMVVCQQRAGSTPHPRRGDCRSPLAVGAPPVICERDLNEDCAAPDGDTRLCADVDCPLRPRPVPAAQRPPKETK